MLLALKLMLAPALVAAVSVAGRMWGERVGGFLAALPIVAAPILLVLQLQHGPEFASRAAFSCAYGVCSLGLFCGTYARLATRLPFYVCAPIGWCVVMLAAVAWKSAPVGFVGGSAAVVVGLTLVLKSFPLQGEVFTRVRMPAWDLPFRMALTAALVLALTGLSGWLGPRWSGVLAPFPIATTVLAVFAHAQGGPMSAVKLLRGLTYGLYSFGLYCVVLGVALAHLTPALAPPVAFLSALASHGLLWRLAAPSTAQTRVHGDNHM